MVEFNLDSYWGTGRYFNTEESTILEDEGKIESPIIPIGEVGTTAIDVGQTGNILQNLDKSIRMGTKKIQLVISGGGQGNPSVLASSYGKEVRRELKEKAQSTGVELTGVELSPSRVSGLAGFNPQSGTINEEQRQNDIRQVKYAIDFAADVAGGGGVDIWSQEFNRNIFDAEWNKKNTDPKTGKPIFFDNNQEELDDISHAQLTKYLVDARSGNIVRDSVVRTNEFVFTPKYITAADKDLTGQTDKNGRVLQEWDFVDAEGNYVNRYDPSQVGKLLPYIDPETKTFKIERLDWNDVERETKKYNKYYKNGNEELKPEEWAYRLKLLINMANVKGHAYYYHNSIDRQYEDLDESIKLRNKMKELENDMTPEQQKRWVDDFIKTQAVQEFHRASSKEMQEIKKMKPSEVVEQQRTRIQLGIEGFRDLVATYLQQNEDLTELWNNIKTPEKYAKNKSFDSYARAGVHAMEVTQQKKLDKPVYVGPEIGWAGQGYGGHPDEFIELVEGSRDEMQRHLMREKGYSKSAAKDLAKKHIKGMLDTSHLTMWYKHFSKHKGETEDDRLKRFNNWTTEQIDKMMDKGVVGAVQVVDSITGEHSHLPPGQGVFDVAKLVKQMKDRGFDGPIVSEGHEEEQFQQGRILTEAWKAFGSPARTVQAGQPAGMNTFRGMQYAYFGLRSPHTYIVGAYSPSNEWSLWSEVPME